MGETAIGVGSCILQEVGDQLQQNQVHRPLDITRMEQGKDG